MTEVLTQAENFPDTAAGLNGQSSTADCIRFTQSPLFKEKPWMCRYVDVEPLQQLICAVGILL